MSVEDIITKINSSEFSEFASKMKQKREENRLKRDNLAVGQVYEGRVTNITNFGAFVSLGFIDGLVHLKELSWKYIKSPEEIVSLNDIIRVQVISIENGKIALSRKALMPKIESLQEGDELLCSIVKKLDYAYIVDIGDYTALALTQNMSSKNYLVGEKVKCNVVSNMIDEKKHHKILVGNISSITEFVNSHVVGEHVFAEYITNIVGEKPNIVVSINGLKIDVPHSKVIDPYLSRITNGDIEPGRVLEFVYTKYDSFKNSIKLSMLPLLYEKKKEEENVLKTQIERGCVLEAEVTRVTKSGAYILICGTNVESLVRNEELSPNKVISASEEVFVGEKIEVVYLGEDEKGNMQFSRQYLLKDRYNPQLYSASLDELLASIGINTHSFIGKVVSINGSYFVTDLLSSSENGEDNGKLLVNPVDGKNLIALLINNNIKNRVLKDEYYQVELDVATEDYRRKEGTPYVFQVKSDYIRKVNNPYFESVSKAFKQHTSPNTNTSVANLLEEVGQGLYTSKKRMFFELLQNADDSASKSGVIVKIQMEGQYFILTHNGYSFNKHDFESITSAAKSTKSANTKKTGYKGIGFKSVFTNSTSVYIKSHGYEFSFDRSNPIYNDYRNFYFLVNDCQDDIEAQKRFVDKFSSSERTFRGVKDIPWQLLPIWTETPNEELRGTIFNPRENVSIALKMNKDTLNEYDDAIKEVFDEPRFMLFLRKTKRIQLMHGGNCLTIQKNISTDEMTVQLVNSFKEEGSKESYRIYPIENIPVTNDSFHDAGVLIKREERLNNRGDYESFLVRIDNDGKSLADVPYVPDRIASSTDTSISFALELDEDGHVMPIEKKRMSLYAYLPMNDHRYKFPFYVNADFIPNSSREGVQSDNPWNFFLFYNIGKKIVSMISSLASIEETNYLKLLPASLLNAEGVDDEALVESFNRGYQDALSSESFILNDQGIAVQCNQIILDLSELSSYIGHEAFYTLTGKSKRLPCEDIDSEILAKDIFNIEKCKRQNVYDIFLANMDSVRTWISSCDDEQRDQFFNWLAMDNDNEEIVASVPIIQYDTEWLSTNELSAKNNYLVTTSKFSSIIDLLAKLGFVCSSTILDGHPLESSIASINEKELFNLIKGKDITSLTLNERLRLVTCVADFENIGDSSIANWPVFRSQLGEFKPLNSMFSLNRYVPVWLHGYMLSKDEYDHQLEKYLIKEENIYSSVVEPSIIDILTKTDVFDVYTYFKDKWTNAITSKLIKNNVSNIISIVELYPATQKDYINSLGTVLLDSNADYTTDSLEYRIIKIAASNQECINILRSKIRVDGIDLKSITLKDEFYVTYGNKKHEFHLSKILADKSESSKLSLVAQKFADIMGGNDVFAQNEAPANVVYSNLCSQLNSKTTLLTVEQFCFLMVVGQSPQYSFTNYSSLRYLIRINDSNLFLQILDFCMANDLGDVLALCLRTPNIVYPCGTLTGKFIDCDIYTLPAERVPQFIQAWGDTDEKKQFLKKFGVRDIEGNDIQRRISFKENKIDNNLWNISDTNILYAFLNWIKTAIQLPVVGENQIEILHKLFATLKITKQHYEEDFSEASEWTNKLYLDWKKTKGITIKQVPKLLPFRGTYDGTCYFKGHEGEYCYFSNSKTIYLSSTKEAASILTDVYINRTIPFEKDDWNNIFLVSANIVNDKDAEIEELKRIVDELRSKKRPGDESEVDEHGRAIDLDDIDETSRSEINKQARVAAKEFLSSLSDYDCENWDPEVSGKVIINKVKYKGKPIVVVVCSSQSRKLYLHPWAFAELMQDPDNLLLNYANDHRIYSLSFNDIFMDNPHVNIVFDTDIVTPSEIAELANKYMYSKKTCFVIENPKHSQSDAISSFGLNEKKEDGKVEIFSLEDIFG